MWSLAVGSGNWRESGTSGRCVAQIHNLCFYTEGCALGLVDEVSV